MSYLGETRRGWEINKQPGHGAFIWAACEICGKERWVHIVRGQPERKRCRGCASKGRIETEKSKLKRSFSCRSNPDHKFVDKAGYVWVHLYRESPFYPMATARNLVLEHRLAMAKSLNRCLLKTEEVHHINGQRSDNRENNLELISRANHHLTTCFCQNCEVRKDIRLLQSQNRALLEQIRDMNLRLMETHHV